MKRILNSPKQLIDLASQASFGQYAKQNGLSLFQLLETISKHSIPNMKPASLQILKQLSSYFGKWKRDYLKR